MIIEKILESEDTTGKKIDFLLELNKELLVDYILDEYDRIKDNNEFNLYIYEKKIKEVKKLTEEIEELKNKINRIVYEKIDEAVYKNL